MEKISVKDEFNKIKEEQEVSGTLMEPSVLEVPIEPAAVWVEESVNEVRMEPDPVDDQADQYDVIIPIPQQPNQVDYRRRNEDIFYPEFDLRDSDIANMTNNRLNTLIKDFSEENVKFIKNRRKTLRKRLSRKRLNEMSK